MIGNSAGRPVGLRIRLAIYGIIILLIVLGMVAARPPSRAVIEVGPLGGSFHQTALQYQKLLAARGIELEIRPKANSLEILADLADPASGIDIGFEVQDASAYAGRGVYSLGKVQLQPLFIFASADLGRRITLTDLRGRRIVMPPINSATSDAAMRMFQLYDITPDNTSFTYMPLGEAAKELRAGRFDAAVFMLAPENEVIRRLAAWSGVRLVSLAEARAIANHMPFLLPTVLTRGIYDVADGIPPSDVTMVAGAVDVVARDGLHPYLIYSLLEAMNEVHRGATLVSAAGAYPTVNGTDLPVYPLAQRYHLEGIPWIYRVLPPMVASFVDRYLVLAVALFVLAELYRISQYITEFCVAVMYWRRRRADIRAGSPSGRAAQ